MIKDMTSASYCLLFFLHFVSLVFFFLLERTHGLFL